MNKSLNLLATIGLTCLSATGDLQAIPLYYQFEGTFIEPSNVRDTREDYYAFTGLKEGETATYIFIVDSEVSSSTRPDGTQVQYGHEISGGDEFEVHRISYYTELTSGPGLSYDGSNSGGFNIFAAYGLEDTSRVYSGISISGRAPEGGLSLYPSMLIPHEAIESYDAFTQWAPGNLVAGDTLTRFHRPDGGPTALYSWISYRLTSISETPPSTVPEPATLWLVAMGLFGVVSIRQRSRVFPRRRYDFTNTQR